MVSIKITLSHILLTKHEHTLSSQYFLPEPPPYKDYLSSILLYTMYVFTLYINSNHKEQTLIQFQTLFAHVDIPKGDFKTNV